MTTFIILPARLESSRLSKKLIQNIGDKVLIEHMILCAKKIKAYAHGEHKNLQDAENIKKSIEMKKFFIFPEKNLKQVNIENNLPDYIIKNKDKFKDWILTD